MGAPARNSNASGLRLRHWVNMGVCRAQILKGYNYAFYSIPLCTV
jgi:hypothetical protein